MYRFICVLLFFVVAVSAGCSRRKAQLPSVDDVNTTKITLPKLVIDANRSKAKFVAAKQLSVDNDTDLEVDGLIEVVGGEYVRPQAILKIRKNDGAIADSQLVQVHDDGSFATRMQGQPCGHYLVQIHFVQHGAVAEIELTVN